MVGLLQGLWQRRLLRRADRLALGLVAVVVSLGNVAPAPVGGSIGPLGAGGSVSLRAAPGPPVEVDDCHWLAPVEAEVVDGFRPPKHPFGPGGNRGLEYDTVADQAVSAVADGRVSFVGPVGGRTWLVVEHANGLSSTYGPLTSTAVVRAQSVMQGDVIASADQGMHLTARSHDRYLDPAPLLDGRCGRGRLVPANHGRTDN